MRLKEAIASALHLLVVLAFLGAGCFFIGLILQPEWRWRAVQILTEEPHLLNWAAGGLISTGLSFLFAFFGLERGRTLRLVMKARPISIDIKLVEQAVGDYFAAHFPKEVRESDVVVSQDKLDIAVQLATLPKGREKILLSDIEQKLGAFLRDRLGYAKPFILTIRSK